MYGPGLPSFAKHTYSTDSDLISTIQIGWYAYTPHAWASYTYEATRDLVTEVANSNYHAAGSLGTYTYRNDRLGRRTDVVTTGNPFGSGELSLFGYNDRSELTSSHRYTGTNPDDTDPNDEIPGCRRAG